jgi:hypothetical protein
MKRGQSTSCKFWTECSIPKKGSCFGELIVETGKPRIQNISTTRTENYIEVSCPHHTTHWVRVNALKSGNTTSCKSWDCRIPTKGCKFGGLIVTGSKSFCKNKATYVSVECKHGVKHWLKATSLKTGNSTSCKSWPECQLTRGQLKQKAFIRARQPHIDVRILAMQQDNICVVCGNVLSKEIPDSLEHLVPIIQFVKSKWSLKEKNSRANSVTNLFSSHLTCNLQKQRNCLSEVWKKHPEYKTPAKQAILLARALRRTINFTFETLVKKTDEE